jgi:hypothetical protein
MGMLLEILELGAFLSMFVILIATFDGVRQPTAALETVTEQRQDKSQTE